ncbi:single-stranded-DNA-specific exonuclease RecJ [candidate division NPL-UPA2 bacterium]|nr:single-stranded-DNA-specific exonuclease RecJ [candidate division NPL-UPA2 bacterium]
MSLDKIWQVAAVNPGLERQLADELGIPSLLARLLINRGIKDSPSAQLFLSPQLTQLHDPYLLNDMIPAVKRIRQARARKEKVLIYGDYDVDGITGVTLLVSVLKKWEIQVSYYIPHRVREGYGLNKEAIEKASQDGIGLIITVDCGITALEEIAYARHKGMEVIITDHHQPGESLPQAVAVINPVRRDSAYPFRELAGVGVAFKLVQALEMQAGSHDLSASGCSRSESLPLSIGIRGHLDLVALGTIADMVPLRGENRILVEYGLRELSQTAKPGLQALMKATGIEGKELTSTQVGFILAPRLNAGGRLGEAERGVKLLLAESQEEAFPLAQSLDRENKKRQQLEKQAVDEGISRVKEEVDLESEKVIVLADKSWHPGVIGIVASRLVEKFYRPVILIALDQDRGKGSARSIEAFHLFRALKECQDLLLGLGGHSQAAGLTVAREKIKRLREKMNEIAHSRLCKEDMIPKLKIDSRLCLKDISLKLKESFDLLGPCGRGNTNPLFVSTGAELLGSPTLVKNNHLKLRVTEGGPVREAIGFRMGDKLPQLTGAAAGIDLAYSLEINEWRGTKTVQLHLKDVRISKVSSQRGLS